MKGNKKNVKRWKAGLWRGTAAAVIGLALPALVTMDGRAAQRVVPVIDGFGPYKLGMSRPRALAADKGGKLKECGEIAAERQCVAVEAAVFDEPAVIYAVLDDAGTKVERIVAQFAPQLTRRRSYRCVRLSEKVFALLAVVYGAKYKQSYDQNRRPLPAVAWDGEEAGRLVFEAKCRTHDEGTPRISVVEHYPDGVKPPAVAQDDKAAPPPVDATAPVATQPLSVENKTVVPPAPSSQSSSSVALAPAGNEPPPPIRVPVGVVEEIRPGATDTTGALDATSAMANLTRELAHAKGKAQPEKPAAVPPQPAPLAAPQPSPPVQAGAAERPAIDKANEPAAAAQAEPAEKPAETVADRAVPAASAAAPDAKVEGRYSVPVDIAPSANGRTSDTVVSLNAVQPSPPAALAPDVEAPPAVPVTAESPRPVVVAPPVGDASGEVPRRRTSALADVPPPVAPAASAPALKATPVPEPPARTEIARLTEEVRPPSYREAGEVPEPTDLEAPEPLMMEEEEDDYRLLREAPVTPPAAPTQQSLASEVEQRVAARPAVPAEPPASTATEPAAPANQAAAAPISLLSVARSGQARAETEKAAVAQPAVPATGGQTPAASAPERPSPETSRASAEQAPTLPTVTAAPPVQPEPQLAARSAPEPEESSSDAPAAGAWAQADKGGFTPVLSGGWRHRAPVPPARPWRERSDALEPEGAASGS